MKAKYAKAKQNLFSEMSSRSMEVFKKVVETYLETGDPVGSRTLSGSLNEKISAATIRNVLQELEYMKEEIILLQLVLDHKKGIKEFLLHFQHLWKW